MAQHDLYRRIIHRTTLGAMCIWLALAPNVASAYTHRTTDTGENVRWMRSDVELRVSPDLDTDGTLSLRVVSMAADAWRGVPSAPDLDIAGETRTTPGYTSSGGENGIYRLSSWRYGAALAVTVTTADAVSGQVLDTDVLVSPRSDLHLFEIGPSADERFNGYDLASVLTHELGHVLGLGESEVRAATMYATTSKGSVETRTLDPDDEEGIVAIYYQSVPTLSAAAGGCSSRPNAGMRTSLGMFTALAFFGLMRRRASLSSYGLALITLTALFGFDSPDSLDATRGLEWTTADERESALVLEAETRDEGGLFWTHCQLELASGERVWADLPGGRVGSLVQIVGHGGVPAVGQRVHVGDLFEAELADQRDSQTRSSRVTDHHE